MSEPDPARARFFALSMIRFAGVALALLGVSIMAKRWIEPADVIGTIFVVIGAIDIFLMPRILARRWRTPPKP